MKNCPRTHSTVRSSTPTMEPAQVKHRLTRATKAVMAMSVPATLPTMLTASMAPAWAASSRFECSGFSFSRFSADVLLRLVSGIQFSRSLHFGQVCKGACFTRHYEL